MKISDFDCPHCPGFMLVEDFFEYEEEYCIRCQDCGYYCYINENEEIVDDE